MLNRHYILFPKQLHYNVSQLKRLALVKQTNKKQVCDNFGCSTQPTNPTTRPLLWCRSFVECLRKTICSALTQFPQTAASDDPQPHRLRLVSSWAYQSIIHWWQGLYIKPGQSTEHPLIIRALDLTFTERSPNAFWQLVLTWLSPEMPFLFPGDLPACFPSYQPTAAAKHSNSG